MTTQTDPRGELAEPRGSHHEEWRSIPGAPDYEVSNLGRVRSWKLHQRGRILQATDHDGYRRIMLFVSSGGRRHFMVHGLVLLAFCGPCPEGQEVRHLDGVKDNNVLPNLTYGTKSENGLDNVRLGVNRNSNKTHCPYGHPYSGDNLAVDRGGWRICRTCRAARLRRRDQRRKEAASS